MDSRAEAKRASEERMAHLRLVDEKRDRDREGIGCVDDDDDDNDDDDSVVVVVVDDDDDDDMLTTMLMMMIIL